LGDRIKKNEMGRAWGRGEVHTGSWWGDLREGVFLEDPDLDGGILNWILKKWCGGGID